MNTKGLKKKSLSAGLVGSGFAAKFHFKALQQVSAVDLDVSGVYSPNQQRREAFAAEHDLNAFDQLEELIEQSDVLHICTPPLTHEKIVIEVLKKNKSVVIEKPLTGYFGDGTDGFNGDTFSRETGLSATLDSIRRMLKAESASTGKIMYAENWIYAPAVQKAREIVEKTNGQILRIQAEQSHSGSHSMDYGKWKAAGGGSLMGKGSHALAAAIYLKHAEGRHRNGKPIRPKTISCRTHAITRMPNFINEGFLRDTYTDVEDYASAHIVFEDGTIADVIASELVHGGVKNILEVHANNHRTICNIGPNNSMQTYNPVDENFKDIYVVEKTGTKQGWSNISPDESWFNGYQHEMNAFYRTAAYGDQLESDSSLAADVITTIYSGYLSSERKGIEISITNL